MAWVGSLWTEMQGRRGGGNPAFSVQIPGGFLLLLKTPSTLSSPSQPPSPSFSLAPVKSRSYPSLWLLGKVEPSCQCFGLHLLSSNTLFITDNFIEISNFSMKKINSFIDYPYQKRKKDTHLSIMCISYPFLCRTSPSAYLFYICRRDSHAWTPLYDL